uniref:Ubiquitin carboxyl-terminal hydrolase 14 n=1 Tax=Anolis carolinensis TaxID=28377 RepID=A0A803TII2_ANOCA|nr:PREDICTED: ubiquitin carboxyl-terminal hydrolase 14 isoform X2 [Anolis carolinensis]|eukprot:XP_008106856.1 PREDICTED: ubiquitin carboxyl-terminal hydrolase 14 isoform X2 [Anolis carolinensis]
MPLFTVNVKWGKEKFDGVELNTDEPPMVFKAQLFALTGVQPDRQKVMVKGGTVKDDDWGNIKIKNGMTLLMMGSAEALPEEPVARPVFVEDMTEEQLASAMELPCGLTNLGNTCYMNATVQCIRSVPELKEALKRTSVLNTTTPGTLLSGAGISEVRRGEQQHGLDNEQLLHQITTTMMQLNEKKREERKREFQTLRLEVQTSSRELKEQLETERKRADEKFQILQGKLQTLQEKIQTIESDVGNNKSEQEPLKKKFSEREINLLDFDRKFIYMEDNLRRNNIISRNFPEGNAKIDLKTEILKWLQKVTPVLNWEEVDLEQVHRLPAGRNRMAPRNIIVQILQFAKKEALMNILRKNPGNLEMGTTKLEVYNDYCTETKNWRLSMKPITIQLMKAGVSYSWGYPTFLKFQWRGKKYRIDDLDKGVRLLKELGIIKGQNKDGFGNEKEGAGEGRKPDGEGAEGEIEVLLGAVGRIELREEN